jgi:hypothetical protein
MIHIAMRLQASASRYDFSENTKNRLHWLFVCDIKLTLTYSPFVFLTEHDKTEKGNA